MKIIGNVQIKTTIIKYIFEPSVQNTINFNSSLIFFDSTAYILNASKHVTESKLGKQAKNSVAPDLPLLPMTSPPLTSPICLPFSATAAGDT